MYYLSHVTQAHQGTTKEQGDRCAKAEGAVPVCSVPTAAARGCQCPWTGKGFVSEALVMAGFEFSSLPTISPSSALSSSSFLVREACQNRRHFSTKEINRMDLGNNTEKISQK